MSIQNIQNDNNKSWLDAKFGSVNAKNLIIPATKKIVLDAGSELILQGNAGNPGDLMILDGDDHLIWTKDQLGAFEEHTSFYEASTFTTTSGTLVDAGTSSFVTSVLSAGTYILYANMEIRGAVAGSGSMSELQQTIPTGATLRQFKIIGNSLNYDTLQSMYIFAVTTPASYTFRFQIQSITGGQQTEIRRVRWLLIRIEE